MVQYRVTLTQDERVGLQQLVSSGKGASRKMIHARILLLTDQSEHGPHYLDEQITDALGVSRSTLYRVRERFVEEGLAAALMPRPMPKRPDKIKIPAPTQKQLIALACSDPPPGRCRWTLELLADCIVQLGFVSAVSRETVRRTLKKTISIWNR